MYESNVEAAFADQLEKNEAVKVYAKLPGWFKVPSPLGSYCPDWAVLVEMDGTEEKLWRDALVELERLRRIEPYDTAARLAMVEWLLKARPGERESCEEIVRLTEGEECESILEATLLLDRARALKALGRSREAWKALDKVLCSPRVRHPELLDAVRRERDSL